ncbi:hypothetical protein ADP71_31440 [Vitreoscilla sp. C1]|uniref:hypothetical protein n=1 Tax=Vitreoscilla sp. (strain C1) TaxID=96942 RepID=UPI000CDCCA8C|nr:hypothetical protein [Vitreoscilla sp. C1]AUZ06322.1 hypothetical protein ADP71_31440 [Vitreoscilla sp. C1]
MAPQTPIALEFQCLKTFSITPRHPLATIALVIVKEMMAAQYRHAPISGVVLNNGMPIVQCVLPAKRGDVDAVDLQQWLLDYQNQEPTKQKGNNMIQDLQLLTLALLACGLTEEQAKTFNGDIDALLDYKFGMAFEDFAMMARASQPFWSLFPYQEPVCEQCNGTKMMFGESYRDEVSGFHSFQSHECVFCCE